MGIKNVCLTLFLSAIILSPTMTSADSPADQSVAINSTITVRVAKALYTDYGKFDVLVSKNGATNNLKDSSTDGTGTLSGNYYIYKPEIHASAYPKDWTVWVKSKTHTDNEGTKLYWSVGLSNVSSSQTVTLSSAGNFSGTRVVKSTQQNNGGSAQGVGTCSDGIKNGTGADAETGIDSGGRCDSEPPPPDLEDPGAAAAEAEKAGSIGAYIDLATSKGLNVKTKGCATGTDAKYTTGLLTGVYCNKPITTLPQVIKIIQNIMNQILVPSAATLFTILIIVGGIVYMTANGNEQRATKAKGILTAAIIGLLITLLAYVLVFLFAGAIGGGVTL